MFNVFTAAIIEVFKIPYYKSDVRSQGKFHGKFLSYLVSNIDPFMV